MQSQYEISSVIIRHSFIAINDTCFSNGAGDDQEAGVSVKGRSDSIGQRDSLCLDSRAWPSLGSAMN